MTFLSWLARSACRWGYLAVLVAGAAVPTAALADVFQTYEGRVSFRSGAHMDKFPLNSRVRFSYRLHKDAEDIDPDDRRGIFRDTVRALSFSNSSAYAVSGNAGALQTFDNVGSTEDSHDQVFLFGGPVLEASSNIGGSSLRDLEIDIVGDAGLLSGDEVPTGSFAGAREAFLLFDTPSGKANVHLDRIVSRSSNQAEPEVLLAPSCAGPGEVVEIFGARFPDHQVFEVTTEAPGQLEGLASLKDGTTNGSGELYTRFVVPGLKEGSYPINVATPTDGTTRQLRVRSAEGNCGEVGRVTRTLPGTRVLHADGSVEPLVAGNMVYQGDRVETPAAGGTEIEFEDGTIMILPGDSQIAIDEFLFDLSNNQGSAFWRFFKGVMVYISGKIGKQDPDNVNIQTACCGIGVRGTEFIADFDDSESLLVLHLFEGVVRIKPKSSGAPDLREGPVTLRIHDDGVFSTEQLTQERYESMKRELTADLYAPRQPTVRFNEAEQTVEESTGIATIAMELSSQSTETVTVPLNFSGSATPLDDYRVSSNVLTIPAGSLSGSVSVELVDDSFYEPDIEAILISSGEPTNAVLAGDSRHVVKIIDDDAAAVAAISLDPSSAVTRTLDEHCVGAKVIDARATPLPLIPLDFAAVGSNPNFREGVTDDGGAAQFCFVGKVAGTDRIEVRHMDTVGTASVKWRRRRSNLNVSDIAAATSRKGTLAVRVSLSPRAVLGDDATRSPISGRHVVFSALGVKICSALTDSSGAASCDGGMTASVLGVLAGGYKGSFAGDGTYSGSTSNGSIVRPKERSN